MLFIFDLVLFANQARSVFYRYGNAADFIFSSLYPRVELEETQFWSLSQFWELLAENRKAVLPRIRVEGRSGVTRLLVLLVTLPIYYVNSRIQNAVKRIERYTSPDLLIRSGQVKKCISSGERASGRKRSAVNSVYLKERHGSYCFSTLSCESYLRAALFGLNHSNRIVFFERVPRNLFVSDFNLKQYSFEIPSLELCIPSNCCKYTVF